MSLKDIIVKTLAAVTVTGALSGCGNEIDNEYRRMQFSDDHAYVWVKNPGEQNKNLWQNSIFYLPIPDNELHEDNGLRYTFNQSGLVKIEFKMDDQDWRELERNSPQWNTAYQQLARAKSTVESRESRLIESALND